MTSSTIAIEPGPFGLPPLHARLQADSREIATRFASRAREVRQHFLDHGALHPDLWSVFSERGWAGLVLPAKYGGAEGGLLGMALVLEAFAQQNVLLWMPVLSAAIGHAINQAGPEPARETWLHRIAHGDALLAMATTEAHAGHNVFRSATEIRRDGSDFVVRGVKSITSGLDGADRVLVFGRAPTTGEQRADYTTVLVDPRAPGAKMTELPMRYREGVRQYSLELDDVRVPQDDLVGAEGQGLLVMWPFTHIERVLTAALCQGVADYALSRAVERAKTRVIAGTSPIGAHQAIGHRLAALHARLESVRLFVYRTAACFDAGADGSVLAGQANMAKLLTADLAFDAADHAVQVLGADAWDEREGWLDVYLDARLAKSGPVSNEFALNYVAEHILGIPAHR
jgi:acyl-CoA dehydrogenase